MDDFIDRVTSGRIFKQIAQYAYGRRASEAAAVQMYLSSRDHSIFEDAEDCEQCRVRLIDEPRVIPESSLDVADVEEPVKAEYSSTEPYAVEYVGRSGMSHFQGMTYAAGVEKPPLIARYPEVFTFMDKENQVGTGVALTEVMVWQFNAAYQGEHKITACISQINSIASQVMAVDEEMAEISGKLEDLPEDFRDEPALEQAVIELQQEVEDLAQLKEDLGLKINGLEEDVQKAQKDIRYAKNQLFLDMKDTLALGGLLEPLTEEIQTQASIWQGTNTTGMGEQPKAIPTPGEIERFAMENARDIALNGITEKTIQIQDAQEKFDSLQDRYHDEYATYLACIEDGTINISKSEFDGMMLLESREATADLIQAEEELEQARKHARELGLALGSYDQESGFVDFQDDGYRESLENQWIAYVDRGRIVRWMESEDGLPAEAECDEWDSKTVDISDSVSAIADACKSRKRIDHWRVMCELLDVERIVGSDGDC
jgi:hypothetical protein